MLIMTVSHALISR